MLANDDFLGGTRQVHADTQRLDARLQRRAAGIVQLHRHQPRGELDHVGFQAERLECVGRFQAEQASADHHTAACAGCGRANAVEILEGAVDQPRVAFGTGNRRHEGVGAGGQDQLVVGLAAVAGDHFLALAVDLQHLLAQVGLYAVAAVVVGFAHRQRFGIAAAEVLRQVYAIVGALALLAEHVHVVAGEGVLFDQLFDAVMPDHAVADDDQCLVLERGDG